MKRKTHAQAVAQFLAITGMTDNQRHRLRITLEPCPCGLDVCEGWLVVGHPMTSDGKPVEANHG